MNRPFYIMIMLPVASGVFAAGAPEQIEQSAGVDYTLVADSNQTQAKSGRDIITDEFFRIDGTLGFSYSPSVDKIIVLDGLLSGQAHRHTKSLNMIETGIRLTYRWQNDFGYFSPLYQISTTLLLSENDTRQRSHTGFIHQGFASGRFTTELDWVAGIERKTQDSNSAVFDSIRDRVFLNLDYGWSDNISNYIGYSYIAGDVVSTQQVVFCNGVSRTDIYRVIQVSNRIEPDDAFTDDYCGDWVSYRIDANTQAFDAGLSYGISFTSALDFSVRSVHVNGDGPADYQRTLISLSYLSRF